MEADPDALATITVIEEKALSHKRNLEMSLKAKKESMRKPEKKASLEAEEKTAEAAQEVALEEKRAALTREELRLAAERKKAAAVLSTEETQEGQLLC
ncbi:hypothetical protein NDU88_007297 [Pleurodeles waltl]|uniref:Uncharacterized protein n=1 Tax=Pleurodeles waltl TaxID=8319 RepID=A0AAV7LV12_PLEWA|nr:hypothetical protein NDU88_007297 [Pleurodeles waltl]